MVVVWPSFNPFRISSAALPFRFSMMPSHQPFEFSEALLELRLLEHPELQVHQRAKPAAIPGGEAAGADIGDQSGDGVSDRHGVVKVGQRIQADPKMTIRPTTAKNNNKKWVGRR
jgi:hypothetical protein